MRLFNDFDRVNFQIFDGGRDLRRQRLLVTQDQPQQRVMLEVPLHQDTALGNDVNPVFVAPSPQYAAAALRRVADALDPPPPPEEKEAHAGSR